jgi:hypothetical protein
LKADQPLIGLPNGDAEDCTGVQVLDVLALGFDRERRVKRAEGPGLDDRVQDGDDRRGVIRPRIPGD